MPITLLDQGRRLLCWPHSERGQGMAEYGLILARVAVVVRSALTAPGTGVKGTVPTIADKV